MLGIYVRLSKEDDESNSISNQIREGNQFAESTGLESKIYNEGQGLGGGLKLDQRPKLKELFDDVKNKKITAVWMRNQERLERNTQVFFEFTELAIKYDLDVYLNGTKFDYSNPSNFLSGGIISMVNTYTRKKQSTDTITSIKDNVKAGLVHGIPPYGYKKDTNRKMIIHPTESKAIKLIFKMSLEGNGLEAIARELNKTEYKTRYQKIAERLKTQPNYDKKKYNAYKKKKWVGGSIQNIIKNEIYKGVRRTKHGEVYILDDAILQPFYYDKVVRHLKENMNNSGKKVKHKYLLNGSCTCGVCGKAFTGRKVEVGAKYLYYQCVTKKHGKNSCGNLMLRLEIFDKLIWDIYFKNKRMLDIQNVNFDRKSVLYKIAEVTEELKNINNKIKQVLVDKEKIIDLTMKDILKPHQVQPRMEKLESEEVKCKEELFDKMVDFKELEDVLKNSVNRYEEFNDKNIESITNFDDKQSIINKYIKNITVTKVDKKNTLVKLEYYAPNVFPDVIVIDRLYHWYALPNMMFVKPISNRKLTPVKEVEILKSIYEDFGY